MRQTHYLIFVFLVGAALALPAIAQQKPSMPRTADGRPSLEGVWDTSTLTPLERPRELGNKAFFTREEAAEWVKRNKGEGVEGSLYSGDKDRRDEDPERDLARAYNEAWWDQGTTVQPSLRTSLITEPETGRLPPLTEAAQKAAALRSQRSARLAEGPEDRGIQERCIVGVNVGPPILPTVYNNNFQIVQTPDTVAILSEMVHDIRTIPTDNSPHLPSAIRLFRGDSRGRWEGDTFVVDTTNYNDTIVIRGSDRNLHVVERFTRVDENTLLYQFRVEDPTAYTAPWAGEFVMRRTDGLVYEYACQEGNRGLEYTLRAARAEEQKAAEAQKEGGK